ncbi:hypothetical protein HU200_028005 [Digitaria exilis]|uniref:Uncharacterized protein n=1 Tax=Digitaria exilis TaxID=1010633 RepID=A0A835ESZ3_9POAL|nr:hypothetical protein HU200_028005 [Digitaria exilis]
MARTKQQDLPGRLHHD